VREAGADLGAERSDALEIIPRKPSTAGAVGWFTGQVWSDVIIASEDSSRLRASNVRFAPGARTTWHRHAVGQTLLITDGFGLVQARGGSVTPVRAGDTVYISPGEWHWHGASPDSFMVHLALMEGAADGARAGSELGDPVTDDEYNGRT
jgi:quercetin dioxygenase-like cupin family protein